MGLYLGSTKIPAISFYKSGAIIPSGVFNIPSNVSQNTYDVTSYAFAKCYFGYGNGRLPERISGDLTEYSNSSATQISPYAFAYTNISSISMPLVNTVGAYAFQSCSKLSVISFPSCVSVGSHAFDNCSSLGAVNLPECSYIASSYAFYFCNFSSISLPKCSYAGYGTFYYCKSLESAFLPSCVTLGDYAFYHCEKLVNVSLPKCTEIGNYTFSSCTQLSTLSLPACTSIGPLAFRGCFRLLSLYLMSTSVTNLFYGASNTFASTPIFGYTNYTNGSYGTVYVPQSLLSSYKNNTNWVSISNRIVGI